MMSEGSESPCGLRGTTSLENPGPVNMDPQSKITYRYFVTDLEGCTNVVEGFRQTGNRKEPYEFFRIFWLPGGKKPILGKKATNL